MLSRALVSRSRLLVWVTADHQAQIRPLSRLWVVMTEASGIGPERRSVAPQQVGSYLGAQRTCRQGEATAAFDSQEPLCRCATLVLRGSPMLTAAACASQPFYR